MRRKKPQRIFISYDFDNDRVLKAFLRGQCRHPKRRGTVLDYSLKEAAPQKSWQNKAREKIRRSDKVIVLAGPKTHRAPGVKKEIKIAHQEGKPIAQLIARKKVNCPRIPGAGRRYKWNDMNLDKLLK